MSNDPRETSDQDDPLRDPHDATQSDTDLGIEELTDETVNSISGSACAGCNSCDGTCAACGSN